MARNGKVVTRKATRDELRRMRRKSPTQIMWDTMPRSQMVAQPPEPKNKGNGAGWGFDVGGKYWR